MTRDINRFCHEISSSQLPLDPDSVFLVIDGVDRPVQELSRVSIPFDRFYMSHENLFLGLPITSKLKELAIISLRGLTNARMREVERPWLGGNTKRNRKT